MKYTDTIEIGKTLVWHSPYSDEYVKASFRGKESGKFVLFLGTLHAHAAPEDCEREA